MATNRLRKKNLREATKVICHIVKQITGRDIDREEMLCFVREARSFFRGRRSRYAFLVLAPNVQLVYQSASRGKIRFIIGMDFSSARSLFGEIRELWQQEAPSHIQRSFQLTWSAMSKEMFLASEGK